MLAINFATPAKIQQMPDYYETRPDNRGGFLKRLAHQIMTEQSRRKENGNAHDPNAKSRPLSVAPTT